MLDLRKLQKFRLPMLIAGGVVGVGVAALAYRACHIYTERLTDIEASIEFLAEHREKLKEYIFNTQGIEGLAEYLQCPVEELAGFPWK